jgi:hypothetical protein
MTCVFSNVQELGFAKDVEPVGYFKYPLLRGFPLEYRRLYFPVMI